MTIAVDHGMDLDKMSGFAQSASSSTGDDSSGATSGTNRTVDIGDKAVTVEQSSIPGLSSLYDDDGITITEYKEMVEREPQIKAALMLKIYARISTGWTIEPASQDPADIAVADFVSDQFEAMAGTTDALLRRAMQAMAYKLSVHEIVYRHIPDGRWAGRIGWQAIKPKAAETFAIKTDPYGNILHLEQRQGLGKIEKLDPEYFMVWAWDHAGDYAGKSDLRAAYRWFKAKDLISRYWNIFLERFAAPTPVGKYPALGTTEADKKAILEFLSKLHTNKAAVVPENWAVDLLEATREGGDYENALAYCDRMMGRSMLVPQLMLDEGKSGSYSLGKSHSESFVWVLNSLGHEIEEEVFGEQLIRRLVDWNFQVESYPKFKFKPYTSADFKEVADAFCNLVDRGIVGRGEEVIRERLNLPALGDDELPEMDETPAGGEAPGDGESAGSAASHPPQQSAPPPAASFAQKTRDWPDLAHAGKCDFARYEATLNDLEADSMRGAARAIKSMHGDLMKAIKRQKIVENRDLKAVEKLRVTHVGELRSSLESAFGHAVHHGAADGLGEIGRGLAAAGVRERPQPKDRIPSNFSEDEATFSIREIIEFWAGKVPVQREILQHYSRSAFTIAGGVSTTLLSRAQEAIGKALVRGMAYPAIEQALNDIFEPYYMTTIDPVVGSSARLHNIVRTNMSEAYNTGRMNLYKDPDVGEFVRAYEYSSVMDDRTSDFCRAWHGKVLKKDDSRWGSILPPNHHQCRSVLIPIVQGEEYTESTNPPGLKPAPGFRV